MVKFFVNGKEYEFDDERKVIDCLRDDLNLLSVKDGCSQGACGTCTVLIDGEAKKCCVQKARMVAGKHIITVEGLSDREKEVFTYAFGRAGAVQCGFCIPGMVMCAKGLIDKNNNPGRVDVVNAIRNNYCRCTGYKKIIDGILLAAKMLRENTTPKDEDKVLKVGDSPIRCDAYDKVLGRAKYADDYVFDDMLYCSAVRSSFPRARVKKIDISEAEKIDGVVKVLTAKDITGSKITGHLKQDWNVLIEEGHITNYLGDAIALVYAENKEALEKGKAAVKIEYEELEFVNSAWRGMEKDAPIVHEGDKTNILVEKTINRGDVEKALKKSKYVVHEIFSVPYTDHAFLEPECCVALPLDGGVYIYSSDQSTYDTRRECANILGLPEEKVIVENSFVGGAFGGKEDMSCQPYAALGAYILKRPVKSFLTRDESLLCHPKRHPMDMDFTMGCDENGKITALSAIVVADTGAYASLGGPVLERACTHAAGPYNYKNVFVKGYAVYTNNPPSGAFRGFGVTQTCFATEMCINKLAKLSGIDPWKIRFINAVKPGEVMTNGQIADKSTGIVETLKAVKDIYYKNKNVGIACAMKNAGVGVGLPDYGRCVLEVKDGKVIIYCGASENGQGVSEVLTQIVSERLKLPKSKIVWVNSTTEHAPDSGCSSGSRHTLISGEAAVQASLAMLKEFNGKNLDKLEGKRFYGEYFEPTDKFGSDKKNPKSHIAYGYATQVCILNDDGTIKQMVGAHEVGKAVNKISVEGQIEGGIVMGMGYALTENLKVENGKVGAKYGTYGLFKADKVPEIEPIIIDKKGIKYSNGSIGCGEIVTIPTAPAIAGAYYNKDGNFRTILPLKDTPYERK